MIPEADERLAFCLLPDTAASVFRPSIPMNRPNSVDVIRSDDKYRAWMKRDGNPAANSESEHIELQIDPPEFGRVRIGCRFALLTRTIPAVRTRCIPPHGRKRS